ncbi:vacuolar cation/proton exchanger 1-like [Phaseolus vulgaris]|uniref:vacuolar cation/proton exchanger 1-like n=1 Tax=Phaseolus vulgaris TaxID=3885 RepID=UPI0035CBAEA1
MVALGATKSFYFTKLKYLLSTTQHMTLSSSSSIISNAQLIGRWLRSLLLLSNISSSHSSNNNFGQQHMTVPDISLSASLGSITGISIFVVPICVIVAWILGIQMNLNFNLAEIGSLALAIITIITQTFILQEGTSH